MEENNNQDIDNINDKTISSIDDMIAEDTGKLNLVIFWLVMVAI